MFEKSRIEAKCLGAKKFYISANSSEEIQAFYKAIGCCEAIEINQELFEKEPFDCHMEICENMDGSRINYIPYDVQTEVIISARMKLLREHLGSIETEIFISKVDGKGFDYNKWRESLWEDLTFDEVFERAKKA